MSTNVVTSQNDWTFVVVPNGTAEQIRNDAITKLQETKGDCFFNADAGINWNYYLSEKLTESDIIKLKSEIIEICYQINNVFDVTLEDFKINTATRTGYMVIKINENIVINVTI